MRIVFTSNHRRTLTYKAVTDHLEASGHEIYWITTGSLWMHDLITSNYVDISFRGVASAEVLESINTYSELSVDEIILSDRILSGKNRDYALAYICGVFSKVSEFVKGVDVVFGETTWAHELIIAAVCNMHGIPYLSPVTVRYPSERFAFFRGILKPEIIPTDLLVDNSKGYELYERFSTNHIKPFYLSPAAKSTVKSVFYHVNRYLNRDTKDMTVPSLVTLVLDKVRKSKSKTERLMGDYIYLPLHVQPEATIDIYPEYRDQEAFVRNVAAKLPEGVLLAVKEHPNAKSKLRVTGDSIVMVDGDSRELIKNAMAVVSVNGTACYEAGLLGIPSYVFTDVFYTNLPTVKYCENYDQLFKDVPENDVDKIIAFLAELYSNSYEGYCESPDVYADALSEENICNLVFAFKSVIYSLSKSSTTAASICSSPN